MILHIVPDEKFIPFLQGLFEEASPDASMWRVFTDKSSLLFAIQDKKTEHINGGYFHSEKFKNDLQVVDCVIFHALMLTDLQKMAVLRRIPKQMPIVWRGWGFDYYGYLVEVSKLRLIMQETEALITKKKIFSWSSIKSLPRKIIGKMLKNTVRKAIDNKFVERINFFSCCVPDDYEALRQALPNFSARFIPLNYYSKEDVFLRGENLHDLSGKDILLGNSASSTNNHIEAMRVLSNLGMSGRKVIVPLSYGDLDYQKKLLKAGEELLGEAFFPLTEFVTIQEYNQIVSSCGNVMMNHVRQQAIGNISAALLRGGKVFLRQENPIYHYYTRLGVKLFPIGTDITLQHFDTELNQIDVDKNKELMTKLWSRNVGLKHVRKISKLGFAK